MSEPELNDQQRKFVAHYCAGLSPQQAAEKPVIAPVIAARPRSS